MMLFLILLAGSMTFGFISVCTVAVGTDSRGLHRGTTFAGLLFLVMCIVMAVAAGEVLP